MWNKIVNKISFKTTKFKVLVYLSFKGPSHPSEISEGTGISPGTVRPTLRTLLNMGYIEQGEDGLYNSVVPFTDIISHLYSMNN